MTKFIHLSDLHIRTDNRKDNNQNCIKVVGYIIQQYPVEKPVILITGDIVDDGHESQYKNAVSLLKPLIDNGFSVLAVPGNHDYGPMGNIYTEKSQRLFQKYILSELLSNTDASKVGVVMEDLYPMVTEIGDSLFIGVDSVVGAEDQFMHFASGEVGKDQRKKLKTILHNNQNSGKNIVVFFHHHPFDRRFVMEMDDAKKVMRLLAGKTDVLCFGHDHNSKAYNDKHNIDWILASGKTTKKGKNYKLQFREITIESNSHSVSMRSFKS